MKDKIIVIGGPTASGKTALSVALAKKLGGEIISADSMQIYRGMDIGTAKVTPQEMEGIPHHMIDVAQPWENWSAARYVSEADPILQDILSRGKWAIIAGGTGLWVDSLISGRRFAPYPETGRRQALEKEAEELGMDVMLEKLRGVDPETAGRLHVADKKRIIRALEVYEETGKTISQHNLETKTQPDKYHPLWLGINYVNRQDLYDRIDLRVELMLKNGLLQEIGGLLEAGIPRDATAFQAIGYKEFFPVLEGTEDLLAATEKAKQESRRYAKRQLTWFRRNPDIHWLMRDESRDFSEIIREAEDICAQWFGLC